MTRLVLLARCAASRASCFDTEPHVLRRALAVLAALVCTFCAMLSPAVAAVGRTTGTFGVSATGQAEYTIPLFTPPGSAKLTPQLALVYGHRSGDGYFGMGWNLTGLSMIARCPSTWAQNGIARDVRNDLQDRFCLDGAQLRLTSGTYGVAGSQYRTELETFARVTAYGATGNGPSYFIVEQKDGLIYEYGNSADSRIESVGQGTAVSWVINKIRDRAGNEVLFNYAEDATNGSFRIDNIQYTRNTSAGLSTPPYTVTFVYEDLPTGEVDAPYTAGSKVKRIKRVDRIDVTYNSSMLVRRYELTYEATLSNTMFLANVVSGGRANAARGVSVLGHTSDGYKSLAQSLGANYFHVPDRIWKAMSEAQRWAANTRFLDRLVQRGDEVMLATQAYAARAGGYFARELEYLASRGYTLSSDGWRMLPPAP